MFVKLNWHHDVSIPYFGNKSKINLSVPQGSDGGRCRNFFRTEKLIAAGSISIQVKLNVTDRFLLR